MSRIVDIGCLASQLDASDADSHASSLYAYSTRSATSGQAAVAKLNSRRTSAKLRTGKRPRVLRCVTDKLKLNSSDSEIDGRTNASQTPQFDSFPDNSNSGSSICSSLPAPELFADRSVDSCKSGISSSSQVKKSSTAVLNSDEPDLTKTAELVTCKKNLHESISTVTSLPNETVPTTVTEIKSNSERNVTHCRNDDSELDDSASSISEQKDQLAIENEPTSSTAKDKVIVTNQDADNVSLKANHESTEVAADEEKIKASISDSEPSQTSREEAKADGCSKMETCEGSEEQDASENIKEKVEDDLSNVKEEPPEIVVGLTHI